MTRPSVDRGHNPEDPQSRAKDRATTLQNDVNLIMEVARDEQDVLAKLETIADGLHDLASLWETSGDPRMADKVRQEEERTRGLMARLSELAGLTTAEAQKVIEEVKRALAQATSRS